MAEENQIPDQFKVEPDAIGGALDGLFGEQDRIASGEFYIGDLEQRLKSSGQIQAIPSTREVMIRSDSGREKKVVIILEADLFEIEITQLLEQVEELLGLTKNQTNEPIPSSQVPDEDDIKKIFEANDKDMSIKPDQADPIIQRISDELKGAEIVFSEPFVQLVVRLNRLKGVSDLLRSRADTIIQHATQDFIRDLVARFDEVPDRTNAERQELSVAIEQRINQGMDLMSGVQGNWDRQGRWPAALLMLQAMSLACLVSSGVQSSLRELALMQRQFYKTDYFFLSEHIDRFYKVLNRLGIYKDVIEASNY
jgi:hypothetical protein